MLAPIATLLLCVPLEALLALCCILHELHGGHLLFGVSLTLAVLLVAALWACRCYSQQAMPALWLLVLALLQFAGAGMSVLRQLVLRGGNACRWEVMAMPAALNLLAYVGIHSQPHIFVHHRVAVLRMVQAAAGSSALFHIFSFLPLAGGSDTACAIAFGLPFCRWVCEPVLVVCGPAISARLPAAPAISAYLLSLWRGGLFAGEARSNPILASCAAAAGWLSSSPSAPP